jgi:hypothetical protein
MIMMSPTFPKSAQSASTHAHADGFSSLSRVTGLILLALTQAPSAVYYVAQQGNDAGPGTLAQPFASLQKGHDVAIAGDTVYIRGGIYNIRGAGANADAGISFTRSGQSAARRICFFAYQDERPIFDFSGLTLRGSVSGAGFYIKGSQWLHFRGLEIRNVPQPGGRANNGIWANPGSNIIYERLDIHNIAGPGLSLAGGTGGNLVLNCDSHHNYDAKSDQGDGQNADGFGVHYQESGPPTILRGCRAWWNSDDGFDCIHQGVAVIVENCWNALSGYKPGTMTPAPSGNGSGFKVGGWGMPPSRYPAVIPRHTVRNSLAFLNKAAGFYQNHQPIGNYFYNNTAYRNGVGFNMLGYDLNRRMDAGMGVYRNNIAFAGTATSNSSGADASNNSWDIPGLPVTAADFESIDTAGVFGPRKPDGSLPDIKFLRLAGNSPLIDKGKDVGLSFEGAAPDLGAFEIGLPTRVFAARPSAVQPAAQELFDMAGRSLQRSEGLTVPSGPRKKVVSK